MAAIELGLATYRELRELRRPIGEKTTGELMEDPSGRPLRVAVLGVEPGPTPPSGPLREPGTGVRGEETAGNMTGGGRDAELKSSFLSGGMKIGARERAKLNWKARSGAR